MFVPNEIVLPFIQFLQDAGLDAPTHCYVHVCGMTSSRGATTGLKTPLDQLEVMEPGLLPKRKTVETKEGQLYYLGLRPTCTKQF
ncbi:hypothetical protein NDU88_006951 [Pleurodeles waltl]|uniref:Uncharacterized protein n=1 Tax=Pleurodeles waltl TaxID=8319 RepID=A0AAV7MEJ0_PLEWA|nr:hypothetical protein NDU88_006951 [Pleurodeles waltl]